MGYINSLPALSTVSYNGISFGSACRVTVSSRPVYNDSDRSIKWWSLMITVIGEIEPDGADAGTENAIEAIMEAISRPRKALTVSTHGFIEINNFTEDMDYGPKPRVISWEPIGGRNACRVHWACETAVSLCPATSANYQGITAFEFSSTYAIVNGITTRTMSGYVELNSRAASVDAFRNAFGFPFLMEVPPGFLREGQNFSVSHDDTRLEFTITDKAINSQFAYPPGVLKITATHTMGNSTPLSTSKWSHEIAAVIEVPLSVHSEWAWEVFRVLAKERMTSVKDGPQGEGLVILNFSVTENIFGKEHSFRVSFQQLVTLTALTSSSGSGLFEGINTNWFDHQASLQSSGVWNPLGFHSMLRNLQPTFDYCENSNTDWVSDLYQVRADPPRLENKTKPPNEKPPKKKSWLNHENKVYGYRGDSISKHHPLQDTSEHALPDGRDPENDEGLVLASNVSGDDSIIQKHGEPDIKLSMEGYARRVGHHITPPALTSVNGMSVREVDREVVQYQEGSGRDLDDNELPIYVSAWRIAYEVVGSVTGRIGTMPEHSHGVDGDYQD